MNVTVWRCDLDRGIASLDTLDETERARAAAFAFEHHRRRYIVAHRFLRLVLSQTIGVSPTTIRMAATEQGKPYLPDYESLAFNMSHADHVAYVAVAPDGALGVDVELHHGIDDLLGVARTVFSPSELAEVTSVLGDEQIAGFLRAWTRKEAYVKAVGVGLGAELRSITVRTTPTDIAVLPRVGISDRAFHIQTLDSRPQEYAAIATSFKVVSRIGVSDFSDG